ncbi:MAG: hypothetical protein U0W65_02390 [Bacteroidia bacterium]
MKKLSLVLFLNIFCSTVFFSQNVKIYYSEKNKTKFDKYNLIGSNSEYSYGLKYKNTQFMNQIKSLYIEQYLNNGLILKNTAEIEIPKIDDRKCFYEKVLMINNRLVFFVTSYSMKNNTTYTYACLLKEDGNLDGEFKLIDEAVDPSSLKYNVVHIKPSYDNKKIIIYHIVGAWKDNRDNYDFKIFDDKLNLLNKQQFDVVHKKDNITLLDVTYSPNNYLYVIAHSKDEKDNDEADLEYRLYEYDFNSNKLNSVIVNNNDKYLFNPTIKFTLDNKVVIASMFTDKKKTTLQKVFSIDESYMVEGVQLVIYSQSDLKREKYEERFMKNIANVDYVYNYELKDIIIKSNTDISFIMEYYGYKIERNSGVTYSQFYFNEILISNFSNELNRNWNKFVFKKQTLMGSDKNFGSLLTFCKNDELNIVFNEINEFHNLKGEELIKRKNVFSSLENSAVVLTSIDALGNMNSRKIADNMGSYSKFNNKVMLSNLPNQCIAFSNKDRISFLKFE